MENEEKKVNALTDEEACAVSGGRIRDERIRDVRGSFKTETAKHYCDSCKKQTDFVKKYADWVCTICQSPMPKKPTLLP